jgi:hypothetical protein
MFLLPMLQVYIQQSANNKSQTFWHACCMYSKEELDSYFPCQTLKFDIFSIVPPIGTSLPSKDTTQTQQVGRPFIHTSSRNEEPIVKLAPS